MNQTFVMSLFNGLEKKHLITTEKIYYSSTEALDLTEKDTQENGNNVQGLICPDTIPSVTMDESDERFHPEKQKTFIAFLFFIASITSAFVIRTFVHEALPDRSVHPPLPDLFFDFFPHVEEAINIAEFIEVSFVACGIVMIALHKHRVIIFRRLFIMLGCIHFMRNISIFVTHIPVPNTIHYCSPKINSTNPLLLAKRALFMGTSLGLSINGRFSFCGDYIFSGHTTLFILMYLTIAEYSPKNCVLLDRVAWLITCTGIFMILLSRNHYTIDIITAYYITTRVFWIYHTLANNPELKDSSKSNSLARTWWFPLFMYFEKNVKGVVPRKYEEPIPLLRYFPRHKRFL